MISAVAPRYLKQLKSARLVVCRFLLWLLSLIFLQAVFLSGCKRSQPTPDPSLASKVASKSDASSGSVEPQSNGGKKADDVLLAASDSGQPLSDSQPLSSGAVQSTVVEQPLPQGSWTKQRLIALTSRGPVIIEMMLRVGGLDLKSANHAAIQPIHDSLLGQLGANPQWLALFELPLIKSGWLGNLRAKDEQLTQLVNMYDKNKDAAVQIDELTEFLTRGLSRSHPFSITDSGVEPTTDDSGSPFGSLDSDQDNVLGLQELQQGSKTLGKLDFNSDMSISLDEISPISTSDPMAGDSMRRGMLKTNSLVFHQPALNADQRSDRKQLQQKIAGVLEHYSFLGSVQRQQWTDWSDAQWKQVDTNSDSLIDKAEMAAIFDVEPAIQIAIDLPLPGQEKASQAWYCHSVTPLASWSADRNSGQFHSAALNILVTVDDIFSASVKMALRDLVTGALRNSQVRQFAMQQLQLQENAFDFVDTDGDQMISDAEFESVWTWVIARQAARIQARWLMVARPWFQLLDGDRNQSISEIELSHIPEVLGKMDVNEDGVVDASELPLTVRLQLARQDQRINLLDRPAVQTTPPGGGVDADWFSAMDTNRDGSIAKLEFLGTNSEFRALDKNGDGFISPREVY